ncbi:MAG: hypothetical protein R3C32_07540 [Chloroflexota bacterium]
MVERYDRSVMPDGSVVRRHQEDGCRILGIEPIAKYADHPPNLRQPSYARMAAILLREARDPLHELSPCSASSPSMWRWATRTLTPRTCHSSMTRSG